MQSNGGLAEARHFRGKDAILSGPAGGIVELAGCDSTEVGPGDVLVVETPGGGGYGPSAQITRTGA